MNVYQEEMEKLGDSKSQQSSARDDRSPSFTLEHLQGIFYILSIAYVTSGVVLLLELFTHHQLVSRGGY